MLDIIGVGDTNVDIVIKVDHLPKHDEKVKGELLGKYPGGIIGNFCSAAARFGAKTGIVAKIGNDEFGKICLDDLTKRGINVGGLVKKDDVETYFCIVHLDHTGEKALTIVETSGFLPKKSEIDMEFIKQGKYVHLTTLDVELASYVISKLEKTTCYTSLDIETTASQADPEVWDRIFRRLDIAFPNVAGLSALAGTDDIDEGAEILINKGVKIVVVTCGGKGVKIYKKDYKFEHPIFQVDVKDTTGAGDCFNAVFLSCLSRDWSIEKAAKFASAAAAMTIRKVGAREGLPTLPELESFIKTHGKSK